MLCFVNAVAVHSDCRSHSVPILLQSRFHWIFNQLFSLSVSVLLQLLVDIPVYSWLHGIVIYILLVTACHCLSGRCH